MTSPKKPEQPIEYPAPEKQPEIIPLVNPEEPFPDEQPTVIPWEDPFETPPPEIAPPNEGW
ncbi:hypothetical protein BH09BAC6_BH09BAC6_31980 [soil metagenome]|jgi:hypothetical protein